MPEEQFNLIDFVKQYVRIGGADNALLIPLIQSAKQYLLNAGIPAPTEDDPHYGFIVALYVDMYYNPGKEKELLQRAIDAYVLQTRNYRKDEADVSGD